MRCVDAWELPFFWELLEASCSVRFSSFFLSSFVSILSVLLLFLLHPLWKKEISSPCVNPWHCTPGFLACPCDGYGYSRQSVRLSWVSFLLSCSFLPPVFSVSSFGFLFLFSFSRGIWRFSRLTLLGWLALRRRPGAPCLLGASGGQLQRPFLLFLLPFLFFLFCPFFSSSFFTLCRKKSGITSVSLLPL